MSCQAKWNLGYSRIEGVCNSGCSAALGDLLVAKLVVCCSCSWFYTTVLDNSLVTVLFQLRVDTAGLPRCSILHAHDEDDKTSAPQGFNCLRTFFLWWTVDSSLLLIFCAVCLLFFFCRCLKFLFGQ